MLHVTATPTSAQIAGTKPNPNLVMENQPNVEQLSCTNGLVSAQKMRQLTFVKGYKFNNSWEQMCAYFGRTQ